MGLWEREKDETVVFFYFNTPPNILPMLQPDGRIACLSDNVRLMSEEDEKRSKIINSPAGLCGKGADP